MDRDGHEAGDSLVELLVALAVLSIGVVALVTALITNVTTTVTNRQQAQADSVLASAGEFVKSLSSSALPFTCTGGATVPVTQTEVPRDPAYNVTYGPAEAVAGADCSKLVAVPVSVTGNGFALSTKVVRRA